MKSTVWTVMIALGALGAAPLCVASTEVADAVMRGDDVTLEKLLSQGADVNAAQADGATALHWAAYRDDVESVQRLLEAGADATAANRDGATPLSLASVAGNARMIELLLEAGADPNARLRNGETPLMMAARTGSTQALDVLLEHGAQVNARETLRGTTALMWAAAYANPEAVRRLIDAGADIALRSDPIPRGRQPYLAPSARERIEEYENGTGLRGATVEFTLDDDGAKDFAGQPAPEPAPDFTQPQSAEDTDATSGGAPTSERDIDEADQAATSADTQGAEQTPGTPDEAEADQPEAPAQRGIVVRPTAAAAAEDSTSTSEQSTPADEAASSAAAADDGAQGSADDATRSAEAATDRVPTPAEVETLRATVAAARQAAAAAQQAADAAREAATAAQQAAEAARQAVAGRESAAVEAEAGAPSEEAAAKPATAGAGEAAAEPTAEASSADDEAAEFIGRRDAPKDWGGLTALIFAAREGDLESVKVLVEAGADVNQQSEYGWTALLTATQNRYYQLGKYLLEHGADPNIANKGGWNALYLATDNRNIEGGDYPTRRPDMDHLEYIKLLLAKGADPNLRMKSSTETRTIFTHQWLYEEGATPFLRAAQSGDLELMKLLVEHGADPTIATEHNVTPLMVASGIGWVEGVTYEWSPEQTVATVEYLLELGADVNAQDTLDGRTALMGAAHKGRNEVVQLLVDHGADLSTHDIGSRDSIHALAGVTWQAIDYADGLVRVGVQSAIPHPQTAALLRRLMQERGLEVPPEGRTLDSICITDLCK